MSLYNNKKLFFLLPLLILNFISNTVQASLVPKNFSWKYNPFKQPDDQNLIERRNRFTKSSISPNQIVQSFSQGSRPGVCYHFAIKQSLELTAEQLKKIESLIVGCFDWVEIIGMPYYFFDQIKEAQPNCLATYTKNDDIFHILHMATVTHKNQYISKLSTDDIAIQHDAWEIYNQYGNQIHFWQLKQEYRNDKEHLFKTLLNIISCSNEMKELLCLCTKAFLTSDNYEASECILKSTMGLDIDARDNNSQTALMLAAQKGNIKLIELYMQHGANINLQDNNGNTAFSLAKRNNHLSVVSLLLNSNANLAIKNKIDFEATQNINNFSIIDLLPSSTYNLVAEITGLAAFICIIYAVTIGK